MFNADKVVRDTRSVNGVAPAEVDAMVAAFELAAEDPDVRAMIDTLADRVIERMLREVFEPRRP